MKSQVCNVLLHCSHLIGSDHRNSDLIMKRKMPSELRVSKPESIFFYFVNQSVQLPDYDVFIYIISMLLLE